MVFKYIVFEEAHPVLFAVTIRHAEFLVHKRKITSAGFVRFENNAAVEVFGSSASLNLIPSKFDLDLIQITYEIGNKYKERHYHEF